MMENDRPLAEILLATYNGEKYLSELLDSVINQTYGNILITISDDSSNDNTMEIIRHYQEQYPNLFRIIVHDERFGNARDNFFFLLKKAIADHVFLCDQDDVWLPEKVEIMMNELVKHDSEPALIHTDLEVVDNNLNSVAPSFVRYSHLYPSQDSLRALTFINTVTGCATCLNRNLINLCLSKLHETSCIIMHDYWLGLISSAFGYIGYIDKPLVRYRQHESNSVGAEEYKSVEFRKTIIDNKKNMLVKKKAQADSFLNLFSEILTADQKAFLSNFSKKRSGFIFWFSHFRYIKGIKNQIGFLFLG